MASHSVTGASAARAPVQQPQNQKPSPSDVVISIRGVGHVFRTKGRRVQALAETDLDVYDREFLTIVGPSGCGKSTLMNLIVGLFPPTTGDVLHRGKRHVGVNRSIGYVTQADNLYPWRTLRQNVEFPLELRMVRQRRTARARRTTDLTGSASRASRTVTHMSFLAACVSAPTSYEHSSMSRK